MTTNFYTKYYNASRFNKLYCLVCFYFPLPSNRLFPTINETSLTFLGGGRLAWTFVKYKPFLGRSTTSWTRQGRTSELGGCEFGQLNVITFVTNSSSKQLKGATLGQISADGATGKDKVVPCLIKHQATKAYRKNEGIPPGILSLYTKQKWIGTFTPGPLHLLGKSPITTGRVCPRTDLDALERQISAPSGNQTPIPRLWLSHYTNSAIPMALQTYRFQMGSNM